VDGDLRIGAWLVRPSLNTVSRNGTTHHLEPKMMEVLVCLAQQAGEPVSKEKLLRSIWSDTFVSDDVLVRSISELRRIFEDDPKNSRFIQTIPVTGVGATHSVGNLRVSLREMARQMEHYYSVGQFDRPVQVAIAYAQLGDKDKVLNWLERAYTDHDEDLMYAFQEAELDFVRSEPRFRALEQKLGLPQ